MKYIAKSDYEPHTNSLLQSLIYNSIVLPISVVRRSKIYHKFPVIYCF